MLSDPDDNEKDEGQVLSDSPDAMSLAEDPPNGYHAHGDSSSEDKHDPEEEGDEHSQQDVSGDVHAADYVEEEVDEGYEDDEEDGDDDEDDEEPALKYERLGGSVHDLLQKDSASAITYAGKRLVSMTV